MLRRCPPAGVDLSSRRDLQVETCVESALRIVLVVAFTRDEALLLVERLDGEDAVSLWPSSVYGWLTRQMLTSRASWLDGAAGIERRLSPWLERFQERSPIELAQALTEGRDALDAQELAALLWALVRRKERALGALLQRMVKELEIALLRIAVHSHAEAGTGRKPVKARYSDNHYSTQLAAVASR